MKRKLIGSDDEAEAVKDVLQVGFSLGREPEKGVGFFLADVRLDDVDLALFLPEFKEFLTKEGSEGGHEDK